MTVAMGTGISAYTDAMKRLGSGAGGAESAGAGASGGEFADLLKSTLHDAIGTEHTAETTGIRAASGKADITNMISAVNNAELTLQSVVAIRDKVVQAYQQILQMPV